MSTPEPAYVLIADAVVAGRQYVRGSLGPAGDFGAAFTRLLSAGLLIAFDPGRSMVEVRPRNARSSDEFEV